MARPLATVVYVVGLLVCGSLNTITMKISFTLSGTGTDGTKEGFQKPWFITFIMFVAMSLALIFDGSIRRCERCRGAPSSGKAALLIDPASNGGGSEGDLPWPTKVRMVCMPAVFDILATGLCSMGFLYIPASVWQLLRGAEMVFAAIFAVTFLGRKLFAFHWLGIAFSVAGIMCVGFASVLGEGASSSAGSGSEGGTNLVLLGMGLALLGQVVQAAQVIAEEWLLKDCDLPGLQIVGFEGVWGGLIMLLLVFPLLYALPGNDHGRLEDEADSLALLSSSPPLMGMIAIYTFSCGTYNMAGIAVTGALSAVHRVMLEALRTVIVWVFGLLVHYGYDASSKFGEAWTPYSWLEVCGFVLLIFGQAVYGGMLHIPGLRYPPAGFDTPAMVASPGAMRNLASPLPAE